MNQPALDRQRSDRPVLRDSNEAAPGEHHSLCPPEPRERSLPFQPGCPTFLHSSLWSRTSSVGPVNTSRQPEKGFMAGDQPTGEAAPLPAPAGSYRQSQLVLLRGFLMRLWREAVWLSACVSANRITLAGCELSGSPERRSAVAALAQTLQQPLCSSSE